MVYWRPFKPVYLTTLDTHTITDATLARVLNDHNIVSDKSNGKRRNRWTQNEHCLCRASHR